MTVLKNIAVADIAPNPANPRIDVGDVADLAASILEQGLIEPVVVAPSDSPTGPPWVLIAGHRRLAALKLNGRDDVDALVREDITTVPQQIEAMLVENLQRSDLTAVEESQAYEQLSAFPGYTPARIARATGRSQKLVKERLALRKLPPAIAAKLHSHDITIGEAEVFVEFAGDAAATKRLTAALGTNNWSWAMQAERDARQRAAKKVKAVKALHAAGVTVIDDFEHSTMSLVTSLLDRPDGETWAQFEARAGEWHKDCPHHAAYLRVYGDPQFVCTKPSVHPEHDGDTVESAEHLAEQARREQQSADLAIASDTRLAHVRALLSRKGRFPDATAVLRTAAIDAVRGLYSDEPLRRTVGELLGLDMGPKKNAAKHLEKLLEHAAAAATPVDVARILPGGPGRQQRDPPVRQPARLLHLAARRRERPPVARPARRQRLRGAHLFRASWQNTLDLLDRELEHLQARNVVLQIDVPEAAVRLDGMLRSTAPDPAFPGVRVAFESVHGPLTYATDAYERQYSDGLKGWQANVRAIALGLEALRAVDRYGVSRRGEQYRGWRQLEAGTGSAPTHMTRDRACRLLSELSGVTVTPDESQQSLRARLRSARGAAHPDRNGGDRGLWDQVEQAAAVLGLTS